MFDEHTAFAGILPDQYSLVHPIGNLGYKKAIFRPETNTFHMDISHLVAHRNDCLDVIVVRMTALSTGKTFCAANLAKQLTLHECELPRNLGRIHVNESGFL